MYKNLIHVMDTKQITYSQMAKVLNCRLRTVSNKVKGNVKAGFSTNEALLLKHVFFPEYCIEFLFFREK